MCNLLGERSEVGVFSGSVGGKNQVHDTFALVEHVAPNARTEQSFRGIAAGRARVAFNGKVVVRKGAHGTDSSQSLRGLLAGTDAEIDVRPQLEIYTDDVRCNHGATAGKLDDNMLFYLLSRGLDRDTAQRLLKWAFLEDVVARSRCPSCGGRSRRAWPARWNESAALKELLVMAATRHRDRWLQRPQVARPWTSSASAATSPFSTGRSTAGRWSTSTAAPPRSGPIAVLRAVEEYETHSHANIHRGVHALSQAATEAFEGARERVRRFINARSTKEIIFVRGTTEAHQPRRAVVCAPAPARPATRSSSARSSTTPTSCPGRWSASRPAPP